MLLRHSILSTYSVDYRCFATVCNYVIISLSRTCVSPRWPLGCWPFFPRLPATKFALHACLLSYFLWKRTKWSPYPFFFLCPPLSSPLLPLEAFAPPETHKIYTMAEEQPGTLGHSVSIAHGSTSPISIEPSQGMRNGRYKKGESDERERRDFWSLFPVSFFVVVWWKKSLGFRWRRLHYVLNWSTMDWHSSPPSFLCISY